MKRSDKDPTRRTENDPGDAMTDDFVPAVGDEAGEEVDAPDDVAAEPSVAEESASSTAGNDAQRMLAEQHDRYLRLAAEYDNYRKRTVRERQ